MVNGGQARLMMSHQELVFDDEYIFHGDGSFQNILGIRPGWKDGKVWMQNSVVRL